MAASSWSLLLLGSILFFGLSEGLRDVRVKVPLAVRRGDKALLKCLYDLEGDSLYAIKWYKGRREFYRYTPKENPPMKVFPISGTKVARHSSNESQVTLDTVQMATSGKYSCEVSLDAPSFHTLISAGELDVVETPNNKPNVFTTKPRYKLGEKFKANCTSRHSKPAANLTWAINNHEANPSHVRHHRPLKDRNGGEMETAFSNIQFIINSQHFNDGKMKIRCTAHIHDVYWQTTEKSIEEDHHIYSGTHGNTIDFSYDSESSDESNYITGLHIQGDVSSLNAANNTSQTMEKLSRTTTIVVSLIFIVLSQVLVKIHLSLFLPSIALRKALRRISSSSSSSATITSAGDDCVSTVVAVASVRKIKLHQFINS
ncbi:hypothetical protein ACFFRR_005032 [Megaselia abdita]